MVSRCPGLFSDGIKYFKVFVREINLNQNRLIAEFMDTSLRVSYCVKRRDKT